MLAGYAVVSPSPTGASPAMKPATFIRGLKVELAADRPVLLLIFLYASAVIAVGLYIEQVSFIAVLHRYLMFLSVYLPPALVLYGLFVFVIPAIIRNPRRPLTSLAVALRQALDGRFFSGLILYLCLPVFWASYTSAKLMRPYFFAFDYDVLLADLDKALHFGADPWQPLWAVFGGTPFTKIIEVLYHPVWFALFFLAPAWVAMSARAASVKRQFFVIYVVMWTGLGTVAASFYSSGGPIFYAEFTGDGERFAPLLSEVAKNAPYADFLRSYLWTLFIENRMELGSGISAFPSLHVALATLIALTLWKIGRLYGTLAWVYVAIVQIGSVHLAWHYAIDGYFSILATWLLWVLVARWSSKRLGAARTSMIEAT